MRLLAIILLSFAECYGQQLITGHVIDAKSEAPVKNVNIIVPGTTKGTITNQLGFFQLEVQPSETILAFSHIGFETSKIEILNEDKFTVTLKRELTKLPLLDLSISTEPIKISPAEKTEVTLILSSDLTIVESNAEFNGGLKLFYNYVKETFHPGGPKPNKITAIQFSVNEKGKVVDVQAMDKTEINEELENDLRLILEKSPSWNPATQRQTPIEQSFLLPIKFI